MNELTIKAMRELPIKKALGIQAVLNQPLFLVVVTHNCEIAQDHQQTKLKRFLISAPNDMVARDWTILNILNAIEDLNKYSAQDLTNYSFIFSHRFINRNHISFTNRQIGFHTISTENVYIKKISMTAPAQAFQLLQANKIADANFDLKQLYEIMSSQQLETPTSHTTNFTNHESNDFEDSFEDENRWNREEYNKSNNVFSSSKPRHFNQGAKPYNNFKRNTDLSSSSFRNSNNSYHKPNTSEWSTPDPISIAKHKPFKNLLQKSQS